MRPFPMVSILHSAMILYVLLLLPLLEACDINAKVEISQSTQSVFGQFTFFNESRGEIFEIKPDQQPIHLHILGAICNMKPTILKTWTKRPENPDVPPLGMTFAFLEGIGDISYTVYDTLGPRLGMRAGVVCGFGDCGGHGK